VRLKQLYYVLLLLIGSLSSKKLDAAVLKTFFDEGVYLLLQDPHHMFSHEDAKKIAEEPRFKEFVSHYDRFIAVENSVKKNSYKKDISSVDVCNAFFRWAVLGGCELDIKAATTASLQDMIVHTNYLLHSFYPQSLDAGLLKPTKSYSKMLQLSEMQLALRQELFERQNVLNRSFGTSKKDDGYLWVLGGAYQDLSLLSWDPSENFVLACGTKGDRKYILIYAYDSLHRDLSLCVEAPLNVDESFVFEPGSLIWGQDSRTFILVGHALNQAKDIAVLYTFNSVKNSIKIAQKIAQRSAAKKTNNTAFLYNNRNNLFVLLGGIGYLFDWDAGEFMFKEKGTAFPGLQHAEYASCSADGRFFLTSHADFPYARLSRPGDSFKDSAIFAIHDKLTDAQWHPSDLYFVARSFLEKDLVLLYRYDTEKNGVVLLQRVRVGADISHMNWSEDGSYLFVHGDQSLMYGAGFRIFALNGEQLSSVDAFTAPLPDLKKVERALYSKTKNMLLVVGKCDHYMNGRMIFSFTNRPVSQKDISDYRHPVVSKMPWRVVDNLFNTVTVYDYLNDIPNQRKVGFGSVVMLVNSKDQNLALSVCDLPEVVCANDGKRFACGKKVTQSDLSAESMSCWWLVEGESWLDRIDNPIKPFARISLKNMATGEKLSLSKQRTPIQGTSLDKNIIGFSGLQDSFSMNRDSSSCFDWEIGEAVSLVARGDVIGLSPEPATHPILKKIGITRLSTKPEGVKTLHDDNSFNWIVYRNISVTTFFDQARQGSECGEYMCKKIDDISGKDAEAVRDVVHSHVMQKSLLF